MRRFVIVALAVLITAPASSADKVGNASTKRDRAVVLAALEDFAKWEGATFGPDRGVLAVDFTARIELDPTAEVIRAVAPKIRGKLSDELVSSLIARNRTSSPSPSLVANSNWATLKPEELDITTRPELPKGVKAVGSFTFPGYSKDGSQALLQIHHSWSMHGAIVTYLLSRTDDKWSVAARDQMVYP